MSAISGMEVVGMSKRIGLHMTKRMSWWEMMVVRKMRRKIGGMGGFALFVMSSGSCGRGGENNQIVPFEIIFVIFFGTLALTRLVVMRLLLLVGSECAGKGRMCSICRVNRIGRNRWVIVTIGGVNDTANEIVACIFACIIV